MAEDNPSNQRALMETLKKTDYWADAAADGYEVLQYLERQPYDLVFMDIKIPERDGLKASGEIRRLWIRDQKLWLSQPMPWPAIVRSAWKPAWTVTSPSRRKKVILLMS